MVPIAHTATRAIPLALEEFKNLGIDFVSYQENIDTSSPLGSAIFTIISAVAQLERDIIAERVKAGLRRAKENGKKLGRPKSLADPEGALSTPARLRAGAFWHPRTPEFAGPCTN